ncbi:MAG: hypothetical protein M3Y41_15180, partial [Pseudomonadota bacterium]|nr:hypothetical protein [Pseudomonadota bacterium]
MTGADLHAGRYLGRPADDAAQRSRCQKGTCSPSSCSKTPSRSADPRSREAQMVLLAPTGGPITIEADSDAKLLILSG